MNERIQFSPTAAEDDHSYPREPQLKSDPVRELTAPLQSLDLELQQVAGEGQGRGCHAGPLRCPGQLEEGSGLQAVFGTAVYMCVSGVGGGHGCALTLCVAAEGERQSGYRVWHLHGQGVGQARGRADLRHPAQLHPRPLPELPAHLAEKPAQLPAGRHQVSGRGSQQGGRETPQRSEGW